MAKLRSLQSSVLVGREDLLALAERRIAETRDGRSALLMLAGEAGIGKTRLVKSTLRQAVLSGFRAAKGDLAPQDRLVPLASIFDLARSMEAETFGSLGPDLLRLSGGKARDSLTSRRILVREIAEKIVDAVDRPTVLAFEDLQWADGLSLEVIGDLARLGHDQPLMLVAAYRLDELPVGSLHREWRARLLTQRLGEEVRLERLSAADTALVTTLILGTGLPAPREVAEAVYARTNGIPLHIEEVLAALGAEAAVDGRSIRDASVPDTIEDAVLVRVQRLGEDARAVARAAAVIGRCFAPDVLAGTMDLPVSDLDGPLRELVDASILYPFEFVDTGYYDFRHQLLRDAVYQSVPTAELRRLHARAGEFGVELVGNSEVHASLHFERAGLRAQAFRAALGGARAAAQMSSRHESFELYRRALANVPADLAAAETAAIYEELAEAGAALDDVRATEEAAKRARRQYEEVGDALGAARLLVVLVNMARRDVRPRSERESLIAQAESELAALPASAGRASAQGELRAHQGLLNVDAGRLMDAAAYFVQARELFEEAGEDDIDIDFFGAFPGLLAGDIEIGLGTMLDVARRARDAHLESSGVTAYRVAAASAIRVMDYATARIGLQEGQRYADQIEQSYCRHVMASTSAHLSWAAGRWEEAIEIAELEVVERGSRRGTLGSRDALAFVAFGRGLVDRARSLLDASLAIGRPADEVELIFPALWGLAETALVAGDPAGSLAYCDEAVELAWDTGERALLVPFVVTAVRAALGDRRPDAAQEWLERVTPLLDDWRAMAAPAVAHADGLMRLAAGSLVAAGASLKTAVDGWDARGRIWESTWARVDLATCYLRRNRYIEASRLTTEVAEIARNLQSSPLEARVRDLQRQARGRRADEVAWYPLTVREFEIARQIAAGRTNAEIASELFVSPKTVSAHVEHILAKLGANRRAEIAAWTASVSQPATA